MSLWSQVKQLHRNVWALGLTSFFNDIASEMIITLLPIYMHANLKTPHVAIGLIEGLALCMSSICKILSGVLADRFSQNLRLLVGTGYFISAISRPLISLAHGYRLIAFLKFMDKAGKSIRGPGRDLMLGLSLRKGQRALAYGAHHMLETFGGVISLALALYILERGASDVLTTDAYTILVLLSLPFGLLAVASVVWIASEPSFEPVSEKINDNDSGVSAIPDDASDVPQNATVLSIANSDSGNSRNGNGNVDSGEIDYSESLRHSNNSVADCTSPLCSREDNGLHMPFHYSYLLGKYEHLHEDSGNYTVSHHDSHDNTSNRRNMSVFYTLLAVVFVFQCFNPPSAFIPLLATEIGKMSIFDVTLMLLCHNAVYSLTVAPTGFLSDRLEAHYQHGRALIIAGAWCLRALLLYFLANAETGTSIAMVWVLYGVYMGLTESLTKVLIVDVLGDAKRGLATAFGTHNAVIGVGDVVAGLMAGTMFDHGRQAQLYQLCACASVLCAGLLLIWRGMVQPSGKSEWEDAPEFGPHVRVQKPAQGRLKGKSGKTEQEKVVIRILSYMEPLETDADTVMPAEAVRYGNAWIGYVDVPLALVTAALGAGPTPADLEVFARNAQSRAWEVKKEDVCASEEHMATHRPLVMVRVGAHERLVCIVGYEETALCKRQRRRTRRGWEWAGRWSNVPHSSNEAQPLIG